MLYEVITLGRERALSVTRGLMILFFVTVGLLVATGVLGVFSLLSFLAIPKKPSEVEAWIQNG